jgi:hypothetical protein
VNPDDLELELRRLRGVRSAGFAERDGHLHVQVHTISDEQDPSLSTSAMRIAYRYSDTPVALEIVRWKTLERAVPAPVLEAPTVAGPDSDIDAQTDTGGGGEAAAESSDAAITLEPTPSDAPRMRERRIRLLATLVFPDSDELEVHLTFEGRRVIGRASASAGLLGAVSATIQGLRTFAPELDVQPKGARIVDEHGGTSVIVSELESADGVQLLGVAHGTSPIEAAARASLQALNRTLAPHLVVIVDDES